MDGKKTPEKDKQKKGKRKRSALRVIIIALLAALVFAAAGFIFVWFYFDIPAFQKLDVSKITKMAQTGALKASDGSVITALKSTEDRTVIGLESVPEKVRAAFLAAEDLRFYKHNGIDPIRIFGAVIANLKSQSFSEGASTITQQLIKLSHLSSEKTLARKLEEAILALELERNYSKNDILAMYLNFVYFGSGAYGIEAASRTYFSKSASELSILEGASLAAILKASSLYNPLSNPESNQKRREYILDTMLENEMITQEEYDEAKSTEFALHMEKTPPAKYGWFTDAALEEAESILGVSPEGLLTGGYTVETTLRTDLQDAADAAFAQEGMFPASASDGTPVQGAIASVDVSSGAVMCMVGGREYTVRRGLNRATQMRRQPGSALKPLAVYTPAIGHYGYTTASVIVDEPTSFGSYSPRNSGNQYYGPVTIRTALANSLNVPAVKVMSEIGVEAGRNYLEKVGIELSNRDSNLSLALGSMTYGVSPVQLAAAYAPFANGGTYFEPYTIERILDGDGRVLYQHIPSGTRVISRQTAYLMTSLLSSVTSSGTGSRLSGLSSTAGKTGTVNISGGGNRDIWMSVYNPKASTAVWMGFDVTDVSHKLSSRISGGDNTAKLALNYLKTAYKDVPVGKFSVPDGIISLEIDKKCIEWRYQAMLASSLTPNDYRLREYFTAQNHPTEESDIWLPPQRPVISVTHNSDGKPVLAIQPASACILRIQRDSAGESIILSELWGGAGETLYYSDESAAVGIEYTYRVIPLHGELMQNGITLAGEQAYLVTEAKRIESSIWDDIWGGIFGKKNEPEQYAPAENTRSWF